MPALTDGDTDRKVSLRADGLNRYPAWIERGPDMDPVLAEPFAINNASERIATIVA